MSNSSVLILFLYKENMDWSFYKLFCRANILFKRKYRNLKKSFGGSIEKKIELIVKIRKYFSKI